MPQMTALQVLNVILVVETVWSLSSDFDSPLPERGPLNNKINSSFCSSWLFKSLVHISYHNVSVYVVTMT